MKKVLLGVLLAANIIVFAQTKDSTIMGAGYANDVYYSFATGTEKTVARDNWHIAFTTKIVDASVRINDGIEVELFLGSTDTSDWANLDTTGNTWAPLHNSIGTWTEGAFNDGAAGHPDYGWGTYNNITHNVNGTKIFVLKLPNGTYKKVMIQSMVTSGDFSFRIANLDNTNMVSRVVNKMNYSQKNFFYYDVINDSIVDREPAVLDWDIMFTKYFDPTIPYYVTGVLLNPKVKASKAAGVDTSMVDWSNHPVTDSISVIGSDWKSFSMGTFSWVIDDSIAYSVEGQDGNLYKLLFSSFSGSASGVTVFNFSVASAFSIDELLSSEFKVYPIPASQNLFVDVKSDANAEIISITGAVVKSAKLNVGENQLNISGIAPGIYLLRVTENGRQGVSRIVIQ